MALSPFLPVQATRGKLILIRKTCDSLAFQQVILKHLAVLTFLKNFLPVVM